MDVERIIDHIEQLQEMFEAPDIRPLSASDISVANRRHDEMLAHSPWFRIGSDTEFVAVASLRHSDWATSSKFETFQSSPPANGESVNSNCIQSRDLRGE